MPIFKLKEDIQFKAILIDEQTTFKNIEAFFGDKLVSAMIVPTQVIKESEPGTILDSHTVNKYKQTYDNHIIYITYQYYDSTTKEMCSERIQVPYGCFVVDTIKGKYETYTYDTFTSLFDAVLTLEDEAE